MTRDSTDSTTCDSDSAEALLSYLLLETYYYDILSGVEVLRPYLMRLETIFVIEHEKIHDRQYMLRRERKMICITIGQADHMIAMLR